MRTANSGVGGMDPCTCIRAARLLVYILTGGDDLNNRAVDKYSNNRAERGILE